MQKILSEIDNNIMMKKLNIMKRELDNMSTETDIMNMKLDSITQIHEKLLLKKNPVGSGSRAIKYLKLQR